MKKRPLIAIALVLWFLVPVDGQQNNPPESSQEDTVRVTSNLVQADVVVTDKDGRHVTDLLPDEFEILEDKRKQRITNFSYITTRPENYIAPPANSNTASAPPDSLRLGQMRRNIAIVVDDLGISFESITFVREALKKFVSEQMQPNDQVAIIRTSEGVGALQQFTSDKRHLHAAIERISWYAAGRGGLSPFRPMDTQQQEDATNAAQIVSEMEEAREARYAVGSLGTLSFVLQGLSEFPGRKAMMLISESFQLFTTQGRNLQLLGALQRLTDQANRASTVIYTIDASGLNPLNLDAADRVSGPGYTFDRNILNQGNPSNISALNRNSPQRTDVPSLRSIAQEEGGSSAAFKRLDALVSQRDNQNIEAQSVLSFLARGTGGLFTGNTNNLSLGTQRMLEDQKGYYLIGYRPGESSIDPATGLKRYHDLTVKVKRPGLRVRSREGYYGVTFGESRRAGRARDEQLAAALTSPFSASGIGLRMTPLFFNDQGAGSYMRVLLHVNTRDLTFAEQPDGSRRTVIDVVAVNYGEGGRVVDQYNNTQTLDVSVAAYPKLLQNGLGFVLNVPAKRPGAYQLRIAARDVASERIGAASQYIEVPDVSRNFMTLSGIVLSGTSSKAIKKAATGTDAASSTSMVTKPEAIASQDPKEEPELDFSPALRHVRQGMTLKYDYVIYNAPLDSTTNQPQLQTQARLLREGKQVFTGTLMSLDTSKQADLKRLNVSGRIRINPELAPGEYVLQVVVTDNTIKNRSRAATVTQSMDFEIIK